MQSSVKQRASHVDNLYCSKLRVIVSSFCHRFQSLQKAMFWHYGHTFHNKLWQTSTNSHGFVSINSATYVIARAIAKHQAANTTLMPSVIVTDGFHLDNINTPSWLDIISLHSIVQIFQLLLSTSSYWWHDYWNTTPSGTYCGTVDNRWFNLKKDCCEWPFLAFLDSNVSTRHQDCVHNHDCHKYRGNVWAWLPRLLQRSCLRSLS